MKLLISIIVFFCIPALSSAQPLATTFEDAESKGISIEELDHAYPSAGHYKPEKGVFKERQDEFINHYIAMHQDLGKYLSERDFKWPKTTQLFTRVYFDSTGSIDYFLINPKKADLSKEQVEHYFSVLNEFIKEYKLPIGAKTNFAQCSPIKYVSKKEKN